MRPLERRQRSGNVVNLLASRWTSVLARAALCAAAIAALASCGSGAVSAPPTVVTPGPISISPSEATLYSDLPTTFLVTGGTGSYVITSSNQSVLANVGAFSGNSITVVPAQVATDTSVILTVRDTGAGTPVSASLTVKPRTVDNTVTITPSASQSAACGTAICSGGDAEVKVTLSQSGIPLRNRNVRFDVVSGDIRLITSPAGLPESLSLTTSTTSDDTGTARIRIRVLADALAQTALLQVTDTSTGFTQRASVTIAPGSNAPLNAQPSTITFQGVAANTCASGISADVIVFGGRPPYLISQPGSFEVSPTIVTQNGGRFTVKAIGQCTAGSQIAVVDSNGATVSVAASNALSAVIATPVVTPSTTDFTLSPSSVALGSCSDVANVLLIGGSGTYIAASGSSSVIASVSGGTGTIRRQDGPAPGSSIVAVAFSDGKTTRQVNVSLSGGALGACPATSPSNQIVATPTSITLNDCTTNVSFIVSGGNPNFGYTPITNGNSFTYSRVINSSGTYSETYFVRRSSGVAPPSSPQQSLTITDGIVQTTVPINFTGAAAASCP
jgi:hypothetical protein